MNADDWNQEYEIASNDKRSLLDLDEALHEFDFGEYYDNNAYAYDTEYYEGDAFTPSMSGSARSCTERIPVILKKLCVAWDTNDGFQFSFHADEGDENDLKWYYGDTDVSDDDDDTALTSKLLSFNDDLQWDNVDLVQNMLHNLIQNDGIYDNLFDVYHKYGM